MTVKTVELVKYFHKYYDYDNLSNLRTNTKPVLTLLYTLLDDSVVMRLPPNLTGTESLEVVPLYLSDVSEGTEGGQYQKVGSGDATSNADFLDQVFAPFNQLVRDNY